MKQFYIQTIYRNFKNAAKKDLENYNKFIKNPKKEIKKWTDYDSYNGNMCRTFGMTPENACWLCPLDSLNKKSNDNYGCFDSTYDKLEDNIEKYNIESSEINLKKIVNAVIKRRDKILKLFKEHNIEV